MTRKELRDESAKALNALTRKQLLDEFAISRVSYLSGLDTIGVPVYCSVRVLSQSVAIHAGKSLHKDLARAGAIAEAIEFEVAEHPDGPFKVCSAFQLPEEKRLGLEDCFPTRSSVVSDASLLAWEEMVNINNGEEKLVPSDLIWMIPRLKNQPLMHLQMGSNGLASGASLEDAILSGLYEIIERDGWTLSRHLIDAYGIMPKRTPLEDLPTDIQALVDTLEECKLKLHIFDATTDYNVPVFNAVILDTTGNCAGTFSGWGANLDAGSALLRAITEAIQGRACYISGARDDLLRRQFLLMKRLDQVKLHQMFSDLLTGSKISEYRKIDFPDVKTELRYLLKFLKRFGVNEVYVKEMGQYVDGSLFAVRVLSPQCEPHAFDHWTPTRRCLSYARRYVEKMADGATTPAEEGETWKSA